MWFIAKAGEYIAKGFILWTLFLALLVVAYIVIIYTEKKVKKQC